MKAFVLTQPGGPENLVLSDLPVPQPKSGEVLVRTKALSINPVDIAVRSYDWALNMFLQPVAGEPVIPGWDIAGIVESVGPDVTSFEPGDAVFGMVRFPGHGKAYAEYVTAPADQLALKPAAVSFESAAATTLAALTAWKAVVGYGQVKKGDRVLIHGVTGGVGHFAAQIARHFGAYVIGTSSAAHRDFALTLVDEHIDYKSTRFEEVVSDVDFVLDGVQMTKEHLERSLTVIRPGGTLVSILAQFDEALNQQLSARQVKGYRVGVVSDGADQRSLAELLESGAIKPHVFRTFAFDELPEAHRVQESKSIAGKVVVTV
jgi:NADPH:quinone reductase-like Zn-dependent oxidoreductase